jgi:hypothetical protein
VRASRVLARVSRSRARARARACVRACSCVSLRASGEWAGVAGSAARAASGKARGG